MKTGRLNDQLGKINAQQLTCSRNCLFLELRVGKRVRTRAARYRIPTTGIFGPAEVVTAAIGALQEKRATDTNAIHHVKACHRSLLQHEGQRIAIRLNATKRTRAPSEQKK